MTASARDASAQTVETPLERSIFLQGYGDIRLSRQAPSGLMLTRHVTVDPVFVEMANTDGFFKAVVVQRTTAAQVHRNGRLIHSGTVPAGTIDYSEPAIRTETAVLGPSDQLIFLLPISLITAVAEQAGVTMRGDAGIGFQKRPVDHRMLALAREAQRELAEPGPFTRLRLDLIGQELVIRMLELHSSLAGDLAAKPRARGGLAGWQLRRACDLMDASLEEGMTLGILAAAVDCSPTHFSRAFKQSTGIAPFAWLLHRRVDRAKALLQDGKLPIADVALAVGFSAQPQFTTAFKRITGSTPAAWRRSAVGEPRNFAQDRGQAGETNDGQAQYRRGRLS